MAPIDPLRERTRRPAAPDARESTRLSATHQVHVIICRRPRGDAGLGITLPPPARERP